MSLNWWLWIGVLLTALLQVLHSHEQRELLKTWQEQDAKREQLQQEYSKLLLERGTLSAHNRLEKLARQQLDMTEPTRIQVLRP